MQNCGMCVTVLTNVCPLYLSHLSGCACRKGPWDVFPLDFCLSSPGSPCLGVMAHPEPSCQIPLAFPDSVT